MKTYRTLYLVNNYTAEVFYNSGAEPAEIANSFRTAINMAEVKNPDLEKELARLKNVAADFFKDYDDAVAQRLFVAVMDLYGKNIAPEWQSQAYKELYASCKGDFNSVTDKLFARSIFTDEKKVLELLAKFDANKVRKDPFYILAASASDLLDKKVRPELSALNARLAGLNRTYMAAQMEQGSGKVFYPDANFTLRLSYGKVMGYDSRDAVYYKHFTTLTGVIEKDNPQIYDYDVPDKLKELYQNKDFGRYAVNGDVPVCFIANNHTTGGNSGSPVLNADGQLIGINFDRAWEGVASDMMFNPLQSRNISLDIRYVLFIIEKFAGADYLIQEMTLAE